LTASITAAAADVAADDDGDDGGGADDAWLWLVCGHHSLLNLMHHARF